MLAVSLYVGALLEVVVIRVCLKFDSAVKWTVYLSVAVLNVWNDILIHVLLFTLTTL